MSSQGELKDAIRLYHSGQPDAGYQLLRAQLLGDPETVNRLLWLAKISSNEREAVAAAELALVLDPLNEVAQRGVVAVHQRFHANGTAVPVLDVMRITGMTQAQARSVIWHFRGHNRPIGVLLDEGVIGLNDLGFAVQKAYDAPVKRAATTLLLAYLLGDGLKDPAPPLTVIEGGSHAARTERISILLFGFVAGSVGVLLVSELLILIALTVAVYSKSDQVRTIASSASIGLLALIIFFPLGAFLIDRFGEQTENSRNGAEGERRLADTLRASLRSPWRLIRNVTWPERRWGDTDAILVGPGGVWAIEVKAYTKDTRNIGDKWQYKTRWGWRNMSKSPGKQARRNAMNVRDYLDLHGVRVKWVQAVVVWAGEDDKLVVEDPAVPVWTLKGLSEQIEALWQEEKLTGEQAEKIEKILNDAIEKDKAKFEEKYGKYTK